MRFDGTKGQVNYTAEVAQSKEAKGTCRKCTGPVRRSHRTGILHKHCFTCRYLMMIYGPNIGVRRIDQ